MTCSTGVGGRLVDGEEHVHHGLIRAAVQWAFKRADGAGDRGVHIGQRRRDHASCKGRGIQLMVGVQNQRDIEGLGRGFRRLLAAQHPDKIAGVGERFIGRDVLLSTPDTIPGGDDHGYLRRDRECLAQVVLAVDRFLVRVVEAECGDGCAQHLHW